MRRYEQAAGDGPRVLLRPRLARRSLAFAHLRDPKSQQHRRLKAASNGNLPNLLPLPSPRTLTPLPRAGSSTPADRERVREQPARSSMQCAPGHRYKHRSIGAPHEPTVAPGGGRSRGLAEGPPCAAAAAQQRRQHARTRPFAASPAARMLRHTQSCARHHSSSAR